jgi:hypothetical protein
MGIQRQSNASIRSCVQSCGRRVGGKLRGEQWVMQMDTILCWACVVCTYRLIGLPHPEQKRSSRSSLRPQFAQKLIALVCCSTGGTSAVSVSWGSASSRKSPNRVSDMETDGAGADVVGVRWRWERCISQAHPAKRKMAPAKMLNTTRVLSARARAFSAGCGVGCCFETEGVVAVFV